MSTTSISSLPLAQSREQSPVSQPTEDTCSVENSYGRLAKAELAKNIDFSSIKESVKSHLGKRMTGEQLVKYLMLYGHELSGNRPASHLLIRGKIGDKMCQLLFQLRTDEKGQVIQNKKIGREVVESVRVPPDEIGGIEGKILPKFFGRMPVDVVYHIFSHMDFTRLQECMLNPCSDKIRKAVFIAYLSEARQKEFLRKSLPVVKKILDEAKTYRYIPSGNETLSREEVHARSLNEQFKELVMLSRCLSRENVDENLHQILAEACTKAIFKLGEITTSPFSFPMEDLSKQIIDLLDGYVQMIMKDIEDSFENIGSTITALTKQLMDFLKLYLNQAPYNAQEKLLRSLLVESPSFIHFDDDFSYSGFRMPIIQMAREFLNTSSDETRRELLPDLLFGLARNYIYFDLDNKDELIKEGLKIIEDYLDELSGQEQAKVLLEIGTARYRERDGQIRLTVEGLISTYLPKLSDTEKSALILEGLMNSEKHEIDWLPYAKTYSNAFSEENKQYLRDTVVEELKIPMPDFLSN